MGKFSVRVVFAVFVLFRATFFSFITKVIFIKVNILFCNTKLPDLLKVLFTALFMRGCFWH